MICHSTSLGWLADWTDGRLAIHGPRFSTYVESRTTHSWIVLIELRRQGIWTEQSWFPSEALFFNMGHVAPELFESFSVILRVNCRYHPGSCKGALNRDFGIRQPLLYRRIGPWRPGYIIPEPSQASSCATNSCCRSVVDTPIFERSCSPIHTNDWILWI